MLLGAVSTSCDDLIEDLNIQRFEMFDDVTHARILKLEIALKNVNHGQGIGFKVGGLVLTKRILFILLAEVLTGLAFILPIMLSHSVLGEEKVATSTAEVTRECFPSAQQVAIIKTMVASEDTANCSFVNLTIGTILGM